MLRHFFIYGFAGWCVEAFWTGLGSLLKGDPRLRSTTYLWMFPIYGAAVFMEPIHNAMRAWPWFYRGLVYTVLIFVAEASSGLLVKGLTGVVPWDYTGTPLAVAGVIRLDYAPAWFVAGLLFERLHDWLMAARI
jgi:uncharacterized membrane protein